MKVDFIVAVEMNRVFNITAISVGDIKLNLVILF